MSRYKKIIIFLPVLLVSSIFLQVYYFKEYEQASTNRLIALLTTVLAFYAIVIAGILSCKQYNSFDIILQSSFYIYLFGVLTLTGYFTLFKQVSAHNWWPDLLHRIHTRYEINLNPFAFLREGLFSYEVIGNFIMLMPLGIYLPLLFRNMQKFISVAIICIMTSVSIELMQLLTGFRVSDVDDVILNSSGAILGYLLYRLTYKRLIRPLQRAGQVALYSN